MQRKTSFHPGTGDVLLSIAQTLSVDGSVLAGTHSLEGLELLVSRQDDEMIPRSPRPTPSAWPMWTKGCSSSPRCSAAIWSMSCGFICVDMFMWVKMIVLNRGVRVYCLNYVFWMFCNAGESYVCNYYPCETWVWWVHATPTHVYYIIIRISICMWIIDVHTWDSDMRYLAESSQFEAFFLRATRPKCCEGRHRTTLSGEEHG